MRSINCSVCSTEVISRYPKKTGRCRPCDKRVAMAKFMAKPGRKSQSDKAWREANPDRVLASKRKYNAKNKDVINAKSRQRAADFPEVALHYARLYQMSKANRTPSWADLKAIRAFYENRPEGMHVDHVIPLRGETVSGLHVEYNLQYLKPTDNIRKGNKFEVPGV